MCRPVSAAVAALLLTAAPTARGDQPNRATNAPSTVDAELLADLDLLDSADYRRDREIARRQGLLERLRLLEAEPSRGRSANPPEEVRSTPGAASPPPARSPGAAGSAGKDKK